MNSSTNEESDLVGENLQTIRTAAGEVQQFFQKLFLLFVDNIWFSFWNKLEVSHSWCIIFDQKFWFFAGIGWVRIRRRRLNCRTFWTLGWSFNCRSIFLQSIFLKRIIWSHVVLIFDIYRRSYRSNQRLHERRWNQSLRSQNAGAISGRSQGGQRQYAQASQRAQWQVQYSSSIPTRTSFLHCFQSSIISKFRVQLVQKFAYFVQCS